MSLFPTTSTTLIETLAEIDTGVDQAAWCRFFELYQPVMVEFARAKGAGDDAEDVVQEVFADLVKVFRAGRYVRERGRFRPYLAKMLRNELISRFRRMKSRPDGVAVELSADKASAELRSGVAWNPHPSNEATAEGISPERSEHCEAMSLEVYSMRGAELQEADDERAWWLAKHRVAVEHVLTKTALSEQSRRIYRELLETGDSCADVARRMRLPAATVRQVKSRVSRMIVAYEKAAGAF